MKKIFVGLALSIILILGNVSAAQAANVSLDPATKQISVGDTIELHLNIDVGSTNVIGSDLFVTYDSSILEIQSINDGSFFPTTLLKKTTPPGKLYISQAVSTPGTYKSGIGNIATLVFKGKANGTSTVTFDCTTGSTSESNIYQYDQSTINAPDIIECGANGKATISVGDSSGGSSTTTTNTTSSGSSSTTSSSSTPSQLPQTGIIENLQIIAIPGAILLLIGGLIKILL